MSKLVLLDPGHGGKYIGTAHYGLVEKTLVLQAALETEKYLKQYKDVEILLTRYDDNTIELKERTDLANKKKADVFVSFHINAFGDKTAHGTSTYYKKGNAEGKKFAQILHDELIAEFKRHNRGLKTSNLHITRESKVPATCLLEVMFLSNPDEAKIMAQSDFPKKYGQAVAKGIVKYLGLVKKPEEKPQPKSDILYRVQTGAFKARSNADALAKKLEAKGFDTYLVQSGGLYKVQVGAYSVKANADAMAKKLKSAGFDTYITTKSGEFVASVSTPTGSVKTLRVGSKIKVKKGAKTWRGGNFYSFVYKEIYNVIQIDGKRIVFGKGKTVTGDTHKNNIVLV